MKNKKYIKKAKFNAKKAYERMAKNLQKSKFYLKTGDINDAIKYYTKSKSILLKASIYKDEKIQILSSQIDAYFIGDLIDKINEFGYKKEQ